MRRNSIIGVILCCLMFILANPHTSFAAENSEGGHWVQDNTGKKYQNADETYPINQWWRIGGNMFWFDSNGYALTGWQKIDMNWYYLDQSGAMQTGWLLNEGKNYYLAENGVMYTGWIRPENAWYYMDSSGAMQTGWVKVDGSWYYMADTGKMVLGTKDFNGSVYKFDTEGALKTVSMNSDEVSGCYSVAIYNEYEQAIIDLINEKRGSSKSVIVDAKLNNVAETRLSSAFTYGYYSKGKTITGQGTLKDYLKTINYKSNKACTEIYIRASSDIDAALTNLDDSFKKTESLKTYTSVGISVQEKNNKLYTMIVFMK